jgi:transcriptional regulator with XRE-family HTH domain
VEEIQAEWFAARLKELRQEAGLDQKQLAERSGVSLGSIRDMEQGRTHPTWPRLLGLCKALGVSCEAFTTPPAEREPAKPGRPVKKAEGPPAEKKPRWLDGVFGQKDEGEPEKPKRPRGRPRKGGGG